MDFPYTTVVDWPKHKARTRILPWINIGIRKPDSKTTIWPLGLVDSGADITIADKEIADELGISFKKAIKDTVRGFGGGIVTIYVVEAEYEINDNSGKTPIIYRDLIAFTQTSFPQTHPQQTAIFGTIGLFRQVKVAFDFPNNIHIEKK